MKKLISKFLSLLLFSVIIISCSSSNDTIVDDSDSDDTTTSNCNTSGVEIHSANTEIESMRQAMLTFRNSLSSTLLSEASNCLDNQRFYLWHNTPNENGTSRDGITYGDLSDTQLNNFKSVLQLFLSNDGYEKVNLITTVVEALLNQTNPTAWNPDYYSIDMFGDPDTDGSWGFQLDGHHVAINFLVHGDNVSIVPAFLGAEPAVDTYNGVDFDVFKNERDLALNLYNGFTTAENTAGVSSGNHSMEVGPASTPGNVDSYRGTFDYTQFANGLKYSDMSDQTKANLILVMKEYVYNLTTNYADIWWQDIMANIDDTYFVWIDETDTPNTTTPFYYRIYNPYVWIEYNNEQGLGSSDYDYNHVHTITRIPNNPATGNGGDYGIFAFNLNNKSHNTLFEHYAEASHHKSSTFKFDYKVILKNKSRSHGHSHSHNSHTHKHS